MEYGEQANGRQIEAKVNQEFEIDLPEARTAGYRWTIVRKGEPVLQLLEDTSQQNAPGVGGAGVHQWRFGAVAAGTAEIKAQYARSWEKESEPARTFTLKVRVAA